MRQGEGGKGTEGMRECVFGVKGRKVKGDSLHLTQNLWADTDWKTSVEWQHIKDLPAVKISAIGDRRATEGMWEEEMTENVNKAFKKKAFFLDDL